MRVLIAHDGSECANAAVVNMRRAGIPSDAEVLLISVVDIGASKSDLREAKAATHDAFRWIESNFPGWSTKREFPLGPPAAVILEKAHSWHPDLIVVGSHGRSLPGRVLLGSVSLQVAHEAPCSVRVVRPGVGGKRPIRIVAGIDGSIQARAVIDELSQRVWPKATEVRIVSVVESVVAVAGALQPVVGSGNTILDVQDSIQRERDRFQEIALESHGKLERTGLIVSEAVVEGNPPHELLAETKRWNADTIFAGARGMGRLEELLLGSVSSSILKHAPCAVEIVRRAC